MDTEAFFLEVYEIIMEIPYGKVTTYGQIAKLMGRAQNARLVGKALKYAGLYGDYPCFKVLNSSGKLLNGWTEQQSLLEQEGIIVRNGKVNLKEYLWEV